jgi:hypothetical protein
LPTIEKSKDFSKVINEKRVKLFTKQGGIVYEKSNPFDNPNGPAGPVPGSYLGIRGKGQTQHRRHLGRRHRCSQHQRYNHGIMGYRTPNIDRIAKEGALFTDSYAQQSCTAGRASFILGQHPFRTGLLTIGMPGSDTACPIGRRPLPIC